MAGMATAFVARRGAEHGVLRAALLAEMERYDDAVGRLVRRPGADDADLWVVGVAADINVGSLGEAPRLMVYGPHSQVDTPR